MFDLEGFVGDPGVLGFELLKAVGFPFPVLGSELGFGEKQVLRGLRVVGRVVGKVLEQF